MAYDGWFEFNGEELINVARTHRLAIAMGLDTVRIKQRWVDVIEDRLLGGGFGLGGFGYGPFGIADEDGETYSDITQAPWYDSGYPASEEFAGIIPLSVRGLDDSTVESTTTEYTTAGGYTGKARNASLSLVWNVGLVGTTERGVEYGKRWMDRRLANSNTAVFCAGAPLVYLRYPDASAPLVHRRNVRLTRGSSITRKKSSYCAVTWLATFTMTAADPFEYGAPSTQVTSMGGEVATGPGIATQGSLDMFEESCPIYDYSPLYDPEFPALVTPPVPPNFLPDGWGIEDGMAFHRSWVRLEPFEPSAINVVPGIALTTDVDTRMVRVCIWPSDADTDELCNALFTAIVTYLPADMPFYVDGERQAAYVWDGSSPAVRRTDSLLYGPDASPIQWTSFNDPGGLLITLDVFDTVSSSDDEIILSSDEIGGGPPEDGITEGVRAEIDFIPKSD